MAANPQGDALGWYIQPLQGWSVLIQVGFLCRIGKSKCPERPIHTRPGQRPGFHDQSCFLALKGRDINLDLISSGPQMSRPFRAA